MARDRGDLHPRFGSRLGKASKVDRTHESAHGSEIVHGRLPLFATIICLDGHSARKGNALAYRHANLDQECSNELNSFLDPPGSAARDFQFHTFAQWACRATAVS